MQNQIQRMLDSGEAEHKDRARLECTDMGSFNHDTAFGTLLSTACCQYGLQKLVESNVPH